MKRTALTMASAILLALAGTACNQSTTTTDESTETETTTETTAPSDTASAPTAQSDCQPLETREANSPDQKPTFPEQTRACGITSDAAFDVVVLAKNLEKPWAVEPLPNGDLLVTEKPGRLRI